MTETVELSVLDPEDKELDGDEATESNETDGLLPQIQRKGSGRRTPSRQAFDRELPTEEEYVNVPLLKLQQLVELCAQVVRESREARHPNLDLERDADSRKSMVTTSHPNIHELGGILQKLYAVSQSDGVWERWMTGEKLDALSTFRKKIIRNVWDNVKPWETKKYIPMNHSGWRWELLSTCISSGNYYKYIGYDAESSKEPTDESDVWHLSRVKLLLENLHSIESRPTAEAPLAAILVRCVAGGPRPSERDSMGGYVPMKLQNIGDLNILDGSYQPYYDDKLGNILEDCYQAGALQRPELFDLEHYINHVAMVSKTLAWCYP